MHVIGYKLGIQALAYNTRWYMVQALNTNNDNYKMGIQDTRYGTRFIRYDTSIWYKIIYKLYKIDKLYRKYLQASLDFGIFGWNTKGKSGCFIGW